MVRVNALKVVVLGLLCGPLMGCYLYPWQIKKQGARMPSKELLHQASRSQEHKDAAMESMVNGERPRCDADLMGRLLAMGADPHERVSLPSGQCTADCTVIAAAALRCQDPRVWKAFVKQGALKGMSKTRYQYLVTALSTRVLEASKGCGPRHAAAVHYSVKPSPVTGKVVPKVSKVFYPGRDGTPASTRAKQDCLGIEPGVPDSKPLNCTTGIHYYNVYLKWARYHKHAHLMKTPRYLKLTHIAKYYWGVWSLKMCTRMEKEAKSDAVEAAAEKCMDNARADIARYKKHSRDPGYAEYARYALFVYNVHQAMGVLKLNEPPPFGELKPLLRRAAQYHEAEAAKSSKAVRTASSGRMKDLMRDAVRDNTEKARRLREIARTTGITQDRYVVYDRHAGLMGYKNVAKYRRYRSCQQAASTEETAAARRRARMNKARAPQPKAVKCKVQTICRRAAGRRKIDHVIFGYHVKERKYGFLHGGKELLAYSRPHMAARLEEKSKWFKPMMQIGVHGADWTAPQALVVLKSLLAANKSRNRRLPVRVMHDILWQHHLGSTGEVRAQLVRLLLRNGVSPNGTLGDSKQTPLVLALKGCMHHYSVPDPYKSNEKAAAALLAGGADPRVGREGAERGFTPLILASSCRYPRLAKAMLERGADVNVRANTGTSALDLAASDGDLELVAELLRRGATSAIALRYALGAYRVRTRDKLAMLELFLKARAKLDGGAGSSRGTALHMAVWKTPEAVQPLLAAGANPNLRDRFLRTPLNMVQAKKPGKVQKRLLRALRKAGGKATSQAVLDQRREEIKAAERAEAARQREADRKAELRYQAELRQEREAEEAKRQTEANRRRMEELERQREAEASDREKDARDRQVWLQINRTYNETHKRWEEQKQRQTEQYQRQLKENRRTAERQRRDQDRLRQQERDRRQAQKSHKTSGRPRRDVASGAQDDAGKRRAKMEQWRREQAARDQKRQRFEGKRPTDGWSAGATTGGDGLDRQTTSRHCARLRSAWGGGPSLSYTPPAGRGERKKRLTKNQKGPYREPTRDKACGLARRTAANSLQAFGCRSKGGRWDGQAYLPLGDCTDCKERKGAGWACRGRVEVTCLITPKCSKDNLTRRSMARRLLNHAMPKLSAIASKALEARTGRKASVAFAGIISAAANAKGKAKEVKRKLNGITRCASHGAVASLDQAVADLKSAVSALNTALSTCR